VKSTYRVLIERGGWIVGVAKEALRLAGPRDVEAVELAHDVPIVERIIDQGQRRIFDGEIVPADEKVYSLFEAHTELLKRGKAGKPVEFGHKVLVAQTKEKFIHHYTVLPRRKEDPELLDPTRKAHEDLFGQPPDLRAADQGFYRSMDQIAEREEDISVVSIGKKGRRTPEEIARESTEAFKEGQRFRADSEGSISGLKRAFKRGKCLFKGFKPYAACVGLAVFCHNLVLLTRL
jgi:IS5 family transposase